MKYEIHSSKELVQLFSEKPYQGQHPTKAKVLILGNDANYSPEISTHHFFENIIEYHSDGVAFWEKTGRHHPFLLDEYPFDRRKGGVRYHKNFSKMNFEPYSAKNFSFIELLNVPTTGNTGTDLDLFFKLLDRKHLQWIENLILGGSRTFVVINQTLVNSINKIHKRLNVMGNLAAVLKRTNVPSVVLQTSSVVLYNGYSFSHSVSNEYLQDLAKRMLLFQ